MEPDSRELVTQASRGDATAVDLLLQRHLPGLQAFVRLRMAPLLRAKESSSDIVQSVCRELLERLDGFEWRGEPAFKAWLFTTALRKLTERQRHWLRDKRDAAREVHLPPGDASRDDRSLQQLYRSFCTPSRVVSVREELAMVEAAFAELPEHYREILTLARLTGATHREIGAQLGMTENAVQQVVKRALVKLSGALRNRGYGA